MTEITCPYHGACGHHFDSSALDAADGAFLKTAIGRNMTFMFLHCPACARMFQFNPVAWIAHSCEAVLPKPATVAKKTSRQLEKLLAKEKVALPPPYLDDLKSAKTRREVAVFEDEDRFRLYSLQELCEDIEVDGSRYLAARQLAGFAHTLSQVAGSDSQQAAPFSLAELAACVAIGEGNARLLFIDSRDNESLWVYHPDGGDVEKAPLTVASLLALR